MNGAAANSAERQVAIRLTNARLGLKPLAELMPAHFSAVIDCGFNRDVVLIENHNRHRHRETRALKMLSEYLASAPAVDPIGKNAPVGTDRAHNERERHPSSPHHSSSSAIALRRSFLVSTANSTMALHSLRHAK